MSDRIFVRDLQVVARHGLLPEEAALGQRFALDVTAHLDLRRAGATDDLEEGVSYAEVTEAALAAFTARRWNLIEAAAKAVASSILERFRRIEIVEVEVRKPGAPIDAIFATVGVAITRRRGRG